MCVSPLAFSRALTPRLLVTSKITIRNRCVKNRMTYTHERTLIKRHTEYNNTNTIKCTDALLYRSDSGDGREDYNDDDGHGENNRHVNCGRLNQRRSEKKMIMTTKPCILLLLLLSHSATETPRFIRCMQVYINKCISQGEGIACVIVSVFICLFYPGSMANHMLFSEDLCSFLWGGCCYARLNLYNGCRWSPKNCAARKHFNVASVFLCQCV